MVNKAARKTLCSLNSPLRNCTKLVMSAVCDQLSRQQANWKSINMFYHSNVDFIWYPQRRKSKLLEISPFNGGNFTISRLSLTLNAEELCRFSFLIIDGPFAYCLSLTA